MPYEIYLPINNYQGHDYTGKYEVSNLGNVRNMQTKKVLKPRKHTKNTGYEEYTVTLSDTNNKRHTETVSRLVISIFKANPDNKPQVGHLNDDSSDNRLNNLYYTTASENNTHNGRHLKVAKKNKIKVECIELNRTFDSAKDAALWLDKKHGASDITKCCKGTRTSCYGYTWKYVEGDVQ